MASSSSSSRSAASERKDFGNMAFAKNKLAAAIEAYTEALTLDPTWAVPLINRALCRRMRAEWNLVLEDCEKALKLDSESVKASYLLGLALMEHAKLEQVGDEAKKLAQRSCRELQLALELAREKGATMQDEIWRAWAKCKYRTYEMTTERKRGRRTALLNRLLQMLAASEEDADADADATELRSVFSDAARAAGDEGYDAQGGASTANDEAPQWAVCPVSLTIFRDPVVSPSGISYERERLLEHINKDRKWDPVTRAPISSISALHPNVQLRNAIEDYLENKPWLYKEIASGAGDDMDD